MIRAGELQRAEQRLSRMVKEAPEGQAASVLTTQVRIERTALDNYVAYHLSTFRQHLIRQGIPLDPRLDAVGSTMFRHFLMVGILAEREEAER